jgi:pilus assembly protein Flp/PilA
MGLFFYLFFLEDCMHFYPRDSTGQGLLEYAMIMMLVALVVMLLILVIGPSVGNIFSNVVSNL